MIEKPMTAEEKLLSEEQSKQAKKIKELCSLICSQHEEFGSKVIRLYSEQGITTAQQFADATCLDPGIYRKLKRESNGNYEFEIVLAICKGLNRDLKHTEELLADTGQAFILSKPGHVKYKLAFELNFAEDIEVFNKLLVKLGVRKLGSGHYAPKEHKDTE